MTDMEKEEIEQAREIAASVVDDHALAAVIRAGGKDNSSVVRSAAKALAAEQRTAPSDQQAEVGALREALEHIAAFDDSQNFTIRQMAKCARAALTGEPK